MELICDAHAYDEDGDDSDGDLEAKFDPELRRLVINGKNICQLSEALNYWMDMLSGLSQLTIAQYTPGESVSMIYKIFLTPSVLWLLWSNLNSKACIFPFAPIAISNHYSQTHHFEDVSESFITDISKLVYFDPLFVLRITRCPLPDLHNFGGAPETLVLEDISASVDLLRRRCLGRGQSLA